MCAKSLGSSEVWKQHPTLPQFFLSSLGQCLLFDGRRWRDVSRYRANWSLTHAGFVIHDLARESKHPLSLLIAETFLPPPPPAKKIRVRRKNCRLLDVRADNLFWQKRY